MKICRKFYVDLIEVATIEIDKEAVARINEDIAAHTPEGDELCILMVEDVKRYLRNKDEGTRTFRYKTTYSGEIYELDLGNFVRDWFDGELFEAERTEYDYESYDQEDWIED